MISKPTLEQVTTMASFGGVAEKGGRNYERRIIEDVKRIYTRTNGGNMRTHGNGI